MDLEPAELDSLVRRARLGDGTAFESLWFALAPRVAAYLRARGVSAVDDVTSEVFLGAYNGISAFAGEGVAFRSWLFTLAHHKSVDAFRRSRPEYPYEPGADPRVAPSAEDEALTNLGVSGLVHALDNLPAAQREVLILRVVADMHVDDVARLIGRSPAAVRQLQKRAVANVRRSMSDSTAVEGTSEPAVPISRHETIAQLP
jgi:RNA polymerase sigma-70 factor (ECF subfamily)